MVTQHNGGAVVIWDIRTLERLQVLDGSYISVSFASNGMLGCIDDFHGKIAVWTYTGGTDEVASANNDVSGRMICLGWYAKPDGGYGGNYPIFTAVGNADGVWDAYIALNNGIGRANGFIVWQLGSETSRIVINQDWESSAKFCTFLPTGHLGVVDAQDQINISTFPEQDVTFKIDATPHEGDRVVFHLAFSTGRDKVACMGGRTQRRGYFARVYNVHDGKLRNRLPMTDEMKLETMSFADNLTVVAAYKVVDTSDDSIPYHVTVKLLEI